MKPFYFVILVSTFLSCSDTTEQKIIFPHKVNEEIENRNPANSALEVMSQWHNEIWEIGERKLQLLEEDTRGAPGFEVLDSTFLIFYDKFISDSMFQVARIEQDIFGVIAECDTNIRLHQGYWEFIDFDVRDDYANEKLEATLAVGEDRVIYTSIRKEIGLNCILGFIRIKGDWYISYCAIHTC